MRLADFADLMFRGGHLSEERVIEAVMAGERPTHLERCGTCADRAVQLGRWLDQVRTTGLEAADAVFPAERLAAQQQQILRRLEQLDSPARVIAFPAAGRFGQDAGMRRVAIGWVGLAAAAGLVIGVVTSQLTTRLAAPPPAAAGTAAPVPGVQTDLAANEAAPWLAPDSIERHPFLLDEFDRVAVPASFEMMASGTPRQASTPAASLSAGGLAIQK